MSAIGHVAVVGSGVAAAVAAAALAHRLPHLRVTIVGVPDPQAALADLIATTTPEAEGFHAAMGIADADLVRRTRGGWRLGTQVTGAGLDYVHAYGPVGTAVDRIPFPAAFDRCGEARSFDHWSAGARLGRAGRLPGGDPAFEHVGVGMALDPAEYRGFLMAYARHRGAVVAPRLARCVVRDGRIDRLDLSDGSMLRADLYVDATGSARAVIGALEPAWIDWREWLPCARLLRAAAAPLADLPTLDHAERTDDGWRLTVALPGRTDYFLACPDAVPQDEAAAALEKATGARVLDAILAPAGRLAAAWIGNAVAIGDAAAVVGPLDAAPLQLLHAQVERLVASLPDAGLARVEIADVNRRAGEEADRLRDFQIAHAPTPAVPPELADTIARFEARGRWRDRDGELADRADWLHLVYGTGRRVRTPDVAARAADPARLRHALAVLSQRLDADVARAPRHRDLLEMPR